MAATLLPKCVASRASKEGHTLVKQPPQSPRRQHPQQSLSLQVYVQICDAALILDSSDISCYPFVVRFLVVC
jgi:hypothetical protein